MSGTPKAPGVWDAGSRRLTTGLLLTISITAFEALAVATVLPAAAADLGGDSALRWYGWVFSAFMLASLVAIPSAGRLADGRGPAWPFLVGSVLFVAGLVVAGLAGSMAVVVAGRVAQGLGAGALSAVVYVAVARGYEARDQPRMLALLASAWVVPGLLGPSAAAAIASQAGWRAVFLVMAPLTVAAAWLAVAGLRQLGPAASPSSRSSVRDALLLAAGTGLALVGAESKDAATTAAFAAVGAVVAVPPLRRLLPAGTLRAARGAPAALAAKALVTFSFFGAEAFLPLALTTVRGGSMAVAGLALTAGTLAWATGTWLQERGVRRLPASRFVGVGVALVAAAVAATALVPVAGSPGPLAIAAWALAGLGIGLSYPATTLVVLERTTEGDEGNAAAALQLANVLGVALGAGVGGAVLGIATSAGATTATAIVAIDVVMVGAALVGVWAATRIGARELPGAASAAVPAGATS